MKEPQFEYGPIAKGIYFALIALTVLVLAIDFRWTLWYILFLFFLGFGLRPFLEVTGLYSLYESIKLKISDKLNEKWIAERRKEIEKQERDRRRKLSRLKDPRLPKDW